MTGIAGKTVLITRTNLSTPHLMSILENKGVRVIDFPLVKISPPSDLFKSLDESIRNLETYDGIIFSSSYAVNYFFERHAKYSSCVLSSNLVAAVIGTGTEQAVSRRGISSLFLGYGPADVDADPIFKKCNRQTAHFLYPKCENEDYKILSHLKKTMLRITTVGAYSQSIPDEIDKNLLIDLIDMHGVDVTLFTSPSSVDHFVGLVGDVRAKQFSIQMSAVPIGPVTESAMIKHGMKPDRVNEYAIRDAMIF